MRRRPKLTVVEEKPGLLYGLYFGKWLLIGSTNREYLEQLKRLMTV